MGPGPAHLFLPCPRSAPARWCAVHKQAFPRPAEQRPDRVRFRHKARWRRLPGTIPSSQCSRSGALASLLGLASHAPRLTPQIPVSTPSNPTPLAGTAEQHSCYAIFRINLDSFAHIESLFLPQLENRLIVMLLPGEIPHSGRCSEGRVQTPSCTHVSTAKETCEN